jgi:hypothetical protein
MFRSSDVLYGILHGTPALLKKRGEYGMNQYGLRPASTYDFINPTQLVNFGRGTSFENLNVRRSSRGQNDSMPSIAGTAIRPVPVLAGLTGDNPVTMCKQETMALRLCMAKGDRECDAESATLDNCLTKVSSVRRVISQSCNEFTDWYVQSVSDNHMKPFEHRTHDWRHHVAQERLVQAHRQQNNAYGKHPKRLSVSAPHSKDPGFAKRPRLPVNK